MESKATLRHSAKLRSERASAKAGNAASGRDSSSASEESIPNSDVEEGEVEAKTEATLFAIPKVKRPTLECRCQPKPTQPEAALAFRKLFHMWSSSLRITESRVTSTLSVNDNAATPLRPRKKKGSRRKLSVGKQKSTTQRSLPPLRTPPPAFSAGNRLPQIFPSPRRTNIKQRLLPPPQPCIEPPKPIQQTLIKQTSTSCSHPIQINKTLESSCSRPTLVREKLKPPLQTTPVREATLPSLQQTQKKKQVTSPSVPLLVALQNPQPQLQLLPLQSTQSSLQTPHWKPLLWPLPLPPPSVLTSGILVPESPLHGGGSRRDDGSQTLSARSVIVASNTLAPGGASSINVEDCTTHWVCLPFGESHDAGADALLPPAAELTSNQLITLEASETPQGCSRNQPSAGNPSSNQRGVYHAKGGVCGRQVGGSDMDANPALGQFVDISGYPRVSRGSLFATAILGGGDDCISGNNSSSCSSSGSSYRYSVDKVVGGTVNTGDTEVYPIYGRSCSSGSSSDSSCLHFGVNPHDFSVVSENPFKML